MLPLKKHTIIVPPGATLAESKELGRYSTIDYIIRFVGDRIPAATYRPAKRAPQSAGDKFLVIKAGTGSGKSTVIPTELFRNFKSRIHRRVVVTQPRILNTMDIPRQITDYNKDLILGKNIGFTTGPYKKMPTEKESLIFMVVDTLMAQLLRMQEDKLMKKYGVIIIDEIHERSETLDSTLFLIKDFVNRNWSNHSCPFFILMSATFDENEYMSYFDIPAKNYIASSGQTYPINFHFAKYDVGNVINYAAETIRRLHVEERDAPPDDKTPQRDILVFIPSSFAATTLQKAVYEINASLGENNLLLPIILTSELYRLGLSEYRSIEASLANIKVDYWTRKEDIMRAPPLKSMRPYRKVFLSTPLAETGVTIDTIKYCIDLGLYFVPEFNPEFGATIFITRPITTNMAIQRRGRVGRKFPGEWYPCYTKETFEALIKTQLTSFLQNEISYATLLFICKQSEVTLKEAHRKEKSRNVMHRSATHDDDPFIFRTNEHTDHRWYKLVTKPVDFSKMDYMTNPSPNSISFSLEKLRLLGMINSNGEPTLLGYFAAKFTKLSIENVRLIFSAYMNNVNLLDVITIASFSDINLKIKIPQEDEFVRDFIKDDFIYKLILWEDFMELVWNDIVADDFEQKKTNEWCNAHNISYDVLSNVSTFRDDIIETMMTLGLNPFKIFDCNERVSLREHIITFPQEARGMIMRIKKCLFEAYRMNLITFTTPTYVLQRTNCPINVPKSVPVGTYNLVCSEILFKERKGVYEFNASDVSIMDNFVYVDFL